MKEILKQGYDVISQKFFVKERFLVGSNYDVNTEVFDSFRDFYKYQHGYIYENSFYFQCPIKLITDSGLPVDMDKLRQYKLIKRETIDDCKLTVSSLQEEIEANSLALSVVSLMSDIKSAVSFDDLCKLHDKYQNISDWKFNQLLIFCWSDRISASNVDMQILIQYLSKYDCKLQAIAGLFFKYDYKSIVSIYRHCDMSQIAESTRKKYCTRLNNFAKALLSNDERLCRTVDRGYDSELGLYYEKVFVKLPVFASYGSSGKSIIYFSNFDEFKSYLGGDLTNCDLLFMPGNMDLDTQVKLYVNKFVSRNTYSGRLFFEVVQQLKKDDGTVLKEDSHSFKYFYEFLQFVKYDLSGMDLSEAFELTHLLSVQGINLSGCKLPVDFCKKFNIDTNVSEVKYDAISLFDENDKSFAYPMINDNIHVFYCNPANAALDWGSRQAFLDEHRNSQGCLIDDIISYVSDIHLEHRLRNGNCKSDTDIRLCIKNIAESVLSSHGEVILITGDVCHTFDLYKMFVDYLYKLQKGFHPIIIFTLGNHELWDFDNVDDAISAYKSLLNEHKMYLLHNNVLLFNTLSQGKRTIVDVSLNNDVDWNDLTKNCRYMMFGGLGFAGYSDVFNANNGIYCNALSRESEIQESRHFLELYNNILPVLKNHNSVVVTHMPKHDWSGDDYLEPGVVYVSGHTHQNKFCDDGYTRLYSDNQVGYKCKSFSMKAFWLNNQFDIFADYQDGIYDIAVDSYFMFLMGHGVSASLGRLRSNSELKMLKRNGYYMFVCRLKSGKLAILNGGSTKTLSVDNVSWYYDHMPKLISISSEPLRKYTDVQKQIAKFIQSWGGVGSIHGCIIDIDFCNHIYLNPFDGTATCYWAENIVNKVIYPSVQMLLEQRNPLLLSRYMNYISTDKNETSLITVNKDFNKPQQYLDTDIYKASRELNKMQKLYDNIITFWPENIDSGFMLKG